MTIYQRIQFLLVLLTVCSTSFPATAKDCITPDCFFERLGEAVCKDNPDCKGSGRVAGQKDTQLQSNVVANDDEMCGDEGRVSWNHFLDITARAGGICRIIPISDEECLKEPGLRNRIWEWCRNNLKNIRRPNNEWLPSDWNFCLDGYPTKYCCRNVGKQACPVFSPPGTPRPDVSQLSCRYYCTTRPWNPDDKPSPEPINYHGCACPPTTPIP